MGDTGLEPRADSSGEAAILPRGGAESGALAALEATIDPSLAAIVEAWPKVPEAIKVGILAMIRAAGD
jgi:hypothetical protein